jgi:hypothetical protein
MGVSAGLLISYLVKALTVGIVCNVVVWVFLFAFIYYNPCFTNQVYRGIFTDVIQFSNFYRFNLKILI